MIPVGAPVRAATGRAVIALLVVAGAFVGFAWLTKEVGPYRDATPWQNDPYDAVVSFTLFFVPIAAALLVMRLPLCRRREPLPASRLIGVQRAGNIVLVAVGATLVTDWVAVIAGLSTATWSYAGWTAIVGLVLVSVVTAFTVALQGRAVVAVGGIDVSPARPDWLDDARVLMTFVAQRSDPRFAGLAGAVTEGRFGIRRHQGLAAAAASLLFGLTIAAAEAVREGSGSSPLGVVRMTVLFATIGTAGMAVFLVVVGRYLQVVVGDETRGSSRHRVRGVAITAGLASIPLSVAFRDQLAALSGGRFAIESPEDLFVLVVAAALATSVVVVAVLWFADRRRPS